MSTAEGIFLFSALAGVGIALVIDRLVFGTWFWGRP